MAQTRRCEWTLASTLAASLPGFVAYLSADNLLGTSIFMAPSSGGAAFDDGRDIRAYSVVGGVPEQIPVEVQFNRFSQTARIWARFPSFTVAPTLRLEWGDSSLSAVPVTGTYGRNAVWQDYALVIHATEDGTTATDSTGNGAVTVEGGGFAPATVAHPGGMAGWKFDGIDDRWSTPARDGIRARRPFTAQAWTARGSTSVHDYLFSNLNNQGWAFRRGGGATSNLNYDTWNASGAGSGATVAWGSSWHSHAVTASATTLKFYDNGAQLGADAAHSIQPNNTYNQLLVSGYWTNGSAVMWSSATFSEWRIRPDVLSADWLATEYSNQSDPLSFWGTPVETDIGGGDSPVVAEAGLPTAVAVAPAATAYGGAVAGASLTGTVALAPAAVATGSTVALSGLPEAIFTAPTGSVSGGAAIATALPAVTLSAPAAQVTASGSVSAAASLPTATVSAPQAYGSGSQSVLAEAGLAVAMALPPLVQVSAGAMAFAALPAIGVYAPGAHASAGSATLAFAELPTVVAVAPEALAAGAARAVAELPTITASAPVAIIGQPYIPSVSRMGRAGGGRGGSAPAARVARAVRF